MAAVLFRGHDSDMPLPANLDQLDADTLRRLLIEQDRELTWHQRKIDQLTHELALPTKPQSRIGELLPHRWKPADGKPPANPS